MSTIHTFSLLPEFRNRLALIGRAGTDAAEWEEIRQESLRRRSQQAALQRQLDEAAKQRGSIDYGNVQNFSGPAFTGRIGHPLGGKGRVGTSSYGWRTHPVHGRRSFHTGVDIGASMGTPIYATHAGTTSIGSDRVWGNRVILSGSGIQTRYAHLSRFAVERGQRIKAGQLLGYVGSTGLSTGPHLHFETWINGRHVNPLSYFMR